jgi:N-acetylneuraminic acid mutarotase
MKNKSVSQSAFFSPRVLIAFLFCAGIACFMLTGATFAFLHPEVTAQIPQRALTLGERVAYQRAIEDVYWRHRIWPKERSDAKPSLDAVMPQAQIKKKVEDYLRDSQTVEDHWQKPITPEQLQAEMDRMAQHTKRPEVLREIFQALGDDPFVIAECLARPVLAQRLITQLNNGDRAKVTKVAWLEDPLQSPIVGVETQAPSKALAIGSTPQAFRVHLDRRYQLPMIASPLGACVDDTWTPTSLANAPSARSNHTAVWTGSEMIVWGGLVLGFNHVNTGGRYDPGTDSWTSTSTTNAPSARFDHTAVWTGSEMIVWGGRSNAGFLNTGGKYNPSTDSWTATSTANAPSGRHSFPDQYAVWTGSEMIVWGGTDETSYFSTGGRYNPGTDSWTATSTTNAPSGRWGHTAVWTGSEMIVWGGEFIDGSHHYLNTGGRYNPSTDIWTATSTNNAPSARRIPTAVWTGSEMIVWGGTDDTFDFDTGGRYNPGTDSWTATSTANAPTARAGHTAVWTSSEMIVWGGFGVPSYRNTGGRYTPAKDVWTATGTTSAPSGRAGQRTVWAGSEMIIWGGQAGFNVFFNTGGRYCAQSGATPTPTPTATATATATPTPTPTATSTPSPSPTSTPTPPPTPTSTPVPTPTPIPTATPSPSATPTPTASPSPTPTITPTPTPAVALPYDFNHDRRPDFVLYNGSTRQTAIWYMHNNIFAGGGFGPTVPAGWSLIDVADFNRDGNNDYVIFNSSTRQTAIYYLSGRTITGGAWGPILPSGWALVATGDFNGDGKPDFVLYNATTRRTAVWYMNNNAYAGGAYGPILALGWRLAGVADFNGNGTTDYALFNPSTRQTAIYYLSGTVYVGSAFGPTVASGYDPRGSADFNGGGRPDYALYKATTRQTALYYLNNNIYAGSAFGPTLPAGWNLLLP